MILPDKNIKLEYSLLNCGALLLKELEIPLTISALWEKVKGKKEFVGYEKFILTVDFLYMINAVYNENGLVGRRTI
jgi:hypothetical protein